MVVLEFSWDLVGNNLIHLAIAYVLALPVAMDREQASWGAGLRTFPLVALAACGYMLVANSIFEAADAQARVLQGLITGIGFIGGGAILKNGSGVKGTATAAGIWITGLIGIAVAYNRYEIAVLMGVMAFLTLHYVRGFKTHPNDKDLCESNEHAKSDSVDCD